MIRAVPSVRVVGHAFGRPPEGGRQESFLHRVLGDVEVAVAPDEGAEDLRCQFPQQALDAGRRAHISIPLRCMAGRTSISPTRGLRHPLGDLDCPVHARAVEEVDAGQKLLASVNGPSLAILLPSCTETRLARD